MTGAAPSVAHSRPSPPRRSWRPLSAVTVFLAVTWWAGSSTYGIGFSVPVVLDGMGRAGSILSEFLSPQWRVLDNTFGPFLETLRMAVVGSTIGCLGGGVLAVFSSKVTAPGPTSYRIGKAILNVVRALPDLLYALIFVAAVGIGVLPGILALILFDIGVVGKLLSETIDGIDPGPQEAARAAGARRSQETRTTVVPQVLPNYVAYSLYTFELNLRASTVLGLVGAGGIGRLLDLYRQRFLYGEISVIIIEIFVVVLIVETISIAIRRRLV